MRRPCLPAASSACSSEKTPFVDDHYLTVDDGFALDSQRTSNLGEALGPIQSRPGEDLLPAPVEMDLNAVAIVLDFMKPARPIRNRLPRRRDRKLKRFCHAPEIGIDGKMKGSRA
jgi:hypothetical protein